MRTTSKQLTTQRATRGRRFSGRVVLLALLVVLLLPAACAPDATLPNTTPSGTLRWSLEGISDLTSLDPARPADQQSNTALNLVFAGLVRLDNNLKVQPDGAESWRVSDDGKTYTFAIRRTLKFGDGTPVTAHDFLYAFNRTLAPATAAYGAPAMLSHIVGAADVVSGKSNSVSGIRVLDDYTLEITLESPRAYFLAQLTYPYSFVVPRKLIEQEGENWTNRAFGTGPFRVKEWHHGERIILEANTHYWRGAPGVALIEMPFFRDTDAAYQNYRQGQLDIMGGIQTGLPAARIPEVQGLPDLRRTNTLTVRYIGFNNRRPPFDNVYVRQAFALAVDKVVLAQQVLSDTVTPTDRILPEGMIGSALPIKGEAFDPVGARAALGLAGYLSGQGLPPVTLTYNDEGDVARVAQALQRFWRDTLGVTVKLEPLELKEFIQRLDQTFFNPQQGLNMYLSIWGADYPDPHNFISQQLRTGSPYNNGIWSDPEFDQLVDQADQMGGVDEFDARLKLYNLAEQIAVTKVGWLPLYNPRANILIRPQVQGLVFTPQGIIAPDWTQVQIQER